MDYEVKIEYKYDEGDYVKCKEVRGENVEFLTKGRIYEVLGASFFDGNVIFTVKDGDANVFHSMDVFEKVGERGNSREYDEIFYPELTEIKDLHEQETDMVNHPKHYKIKGLDGLEVIDVIDAIAGELEDGKEAHYIATSLAYLMRQHKKNGIQDVEKAIWYLQRMVDDYYANL